MDSSPLIPPDALHFHSTMDVHSAIVALIKRAEPHAQVCIRPCRRKVPHLVYTQGQDWLRAAGDLAAAYGKRLVRDEAGCFRLRAATMAERRWNR